LQCFPRLRINPNLTIAYILKNIWARRFPPVNFLLGGTQTTVAVVNAAFAALVTFFHYFYLPASIANYLTDAQSVASRLKRPAVCIACIATVAHTGPLDKQRYQHTLQKTSWQDALSSLCCLALFQCGKCYARVSHRLVKS
jgi:hypothetical protein